MVGRLCWMVRILLLSCVQATELVGRVKLSVDHSQQVPRANVTIASANGTHVFHAQDLEYQVSSAFSLSSVVVAGHHADKEEVRRELEAKKHPSTFHKRMPGGGWVVVTYSHQDQVHVVIMRNDEYIHVEPFQHMKGHIDADRSRILLEQAQQANLGNSFHVIKRRLRSPMESLHKHSDSATPHSRSLQSLEESQVCDAFWLDQTGAAMIESRLDAANRRSKESVSNEKERNREEGEQENMWDLFLDQHAKRMQAVYLQQQRTRSQDDQNRRSLEIEYLYENRAKRWENCFPEEEELHFAEIGLVLDYGFVSLFGSPGQALKAVESYVAAANMVLHYQFHVQVRVRQILLVVGALVNPTEEISEENIFLNFFQADAGGTLGSRCVSSSACVCDITSNRTDCEKEQAVCGINQNLNALTLFSSQLADRVSANMEPRQNSYPFDSFSMEESELTKLAHWHLFTACFQSPGTVGTAWTLRAQQPTDRTGTTCRNGLNTAVTSKDRDTWVTFVHEFGHSLGMQHSFEEGQGQTGGLMDYGDGKYEGVFQFNEKYRRKEVCGELSYLKTFGPCDGSATSSPLFVKRTGGCVTNPDVPNTYGLYCEGGFCPVYEDGSIGPCRPIPPALIFNGEQIEFRSSVIGTQLSGYGFPTEYEWKVVPEDGLLCQPLAAGTFSDKDIVLVRRGGCSFDDKAENAASAGAAALVVFDSEPTEELVPMFGNSENLLLKTGFVRFETGERLSEEIKKAARENRVMKGFFGAAPPVLLKHGDDYDLPRKDDGRNALLFVGAGTGVIMILLAGGLYSYFQGKATSQHHTVEVQKTTDVGLPHML